jgi:hypothetical protein
MRLLFVAFAISFCALLWVAFSVARHILRHDRGRASSADAAVEGVIRKGKVQDGVAAPVESRRP